VGLPHCVFCGNHITSPLKSNLVGPVVNIPAEIIVQELAQGHLRLSRI
jgi:hypothetical protein